jgi:hypothetical protein
MEKIVTPEEKARFNELNRLRMRTWRDKKRVRKYAPRGQYRKDISNVQTEEGKKP